MKLFLDTANVSQVKAWLQTGLLDGVTTNPTSLAKESEPRAAIEQLCSLFPNGHVSVEVTQQDPNDVYKQAQELARIADNVVVKIPCYGPYYGIIKKLIDQNIKLNITLVFSLVQASFMCKLGVTYISPFVGRWDDLDVQGSDILFEIRAMIDQYGFDTQMLAASIRSVRHMHEALLAGADAITVSEKILAKATEHMLTTEGMRKFTADWAKSGVTQFP
jgi:transaldolase